MNIIQMVRVVKNCWRIYTGRGPMVFRLNDCDWYVAYGPYAAISKAMDDTGMSRKEILDGYGPDFIPRPVGPLELERLIFTDDKDRRSFAEELDRRVYLGATFPEMFASTEY